MNRFALLASSASGLLLPRHALGEADTRRLVMVCDHPGCRNAPDRAPCIVIPGSNPGTRWLPGFRPIRIMTTLHFCLPHAVPGAFDLAGWLTAHNKSRVEDTARRLRARGFKPDFEAATQKWELVTTPEYRQFLTELGIDRVYTA